MTTTITYEFAVRIHCAMRDVPGPHVLDCDDYAMAMVRLQWWQAHRPDAQPELLRRTVTTTVAEWEPAARLAADDFHDAVCTGPGVPTGFTCSHPTHAARLAAESTPGDSQ